MKHSVALLAALALPVLGKLNLRQRDSPAVVGLDINRNDISDPVTRDRRRLKRDKTVSTVLDNEVCWLLVAELGDHKINCCSRSHR